MPIKIENLDKLADLEVPEIRPEPWTVKKMFDELWEIVQAIDRSVLDKEDLFFFYSLVTEHSYKLIKNYYNIVKKQGLL